MSAPDFTVDVFQNEYLPGSARVVNEVFPAAASWSNVT
jgi:hypothetical protein